LIWYSVDERIILKWNSKEWGRGINWIDLAQCRWKDDIKTDFQGVG